MKACVEAGDKYVEHVLSGTMLFWVGNCANHW